MARIKKPSTVAGNNCYCNILFLKNRPSPTGRYQLKLRLTINSQPVKGAQVQKLDCPIIYKDETIRLTEFEFNTETNRATAGFENGELRLFNLYLHELMLKAVAIGDIAYKGKQILTHRIFRDRLYEQVPTPQRDLISIPVFESRQKPELKTIRLDFPKERKIETIKSVDEDGFLIKTEKEIIIDPLSLEDFPHNFDKTLFEKYYTEYLQLNRGMLNDPKYQDDEQKSEINNAWVLGDLKKYIQDIFYQSSEKETVTITPETNSTLRKSKRQNSIR